MRIIVPKDNPEESVDFSAIVKEICEESPSQKESISEEDSGVSLNLEDEMAKIEHSINKSVRIQTK